MMGITVYRCQQIKENNCEQSTVLYVIAVQSLKPATLRDTLTASQWSGMWFFSLAFFAVIFMEMLSDFFFGAPASQWDAAVSQNPPLVRDTGRFRGQILTRGGFWRLLRRGRGACGPRERVRGVRACDARCSRVRACGPRGQLRVSRLAPTWRRGRP